MKISTLMWFAVMAGASAGALSQDIKCVDENKKYPIPDKINRSSVADQLTYAEEVAGQAKRAQKMLDQRVGDFIERIDRDWSWDDDRRKAMVAVATHGKQKLAAINDDVKKLDEKTGKLKDIYLELKGDPAPVVSIEDGPVKAARKQAEGAKKALDESSAADDKLKLAIIRLATLEHASAAEQKAAVEELAALSTDAKAKKNAWDQQREELLTAATTLVDNAKVKTAATVRWSEQLCRVASDSGAIAANSNDAMTSIVMVTLDAKDDNRARKQQEVVQFLQFLESHPLLNSELSGSGIQFTSTAGDGKISFKHSLQFGRTTSQQLSFTASAPTSEKNPMKNSVLLDKLEGATTLKLDYTKINQINKILTDVASYTVWGTSAQGGYQKFSYLDPATSFADPAKPTEVESRNRSYSMAVYGGLATRWNNLLLLRYARQYQREKQDSVVVCPPMPAGATWVACNTGSMGEPKGKKYNIWSGEYRQQIGKFAISGILSYDKSSKIRAFALPVYLPIFNAGYGVFGDTSPQLSAGLIAGWRSDSGSSIGFFAGMPFSLSKSE